jgi:hypothetical protein
MTPNAKAARDGRSSDKLTGAGMFADPAACAAPATALPARPLTPGGAGPLSRRPGPCRRTRC